jgi:hypothetical protein
VTLTWRLLCGSATLREKKIGEAKIDFGAAKKGVRAKAQKTQRFAKLSFSHLSINCEDRP